MTKNNSPFIEKLQKILYDPQNSDVIEFNQLTSKIEIFNKKGMEIILSKHFRHSRFESFVRQLNWYGFYKVHSKRNITYGHPDLEKGQKLCNIKSRRKLVIDKNNEKNTQKTNSMLSIEKQIQNIQNNLPSQNKQKLQVKLTDNEQVKRQHEQDANVLMQIIPLQQFCGLSNIQAPCVNFYLYYI